MTTTNYIKCECGNGTITPSQISNYQTLYKGKTYIIPVANVRLCNACDRIYISGKELHRWKDTYFKPRNNSWFRNFCQLVLAICVTFAVFIFAAITLIFLILTVYFIAFSCVFVLK